jgi:hypothetical protein
MTFADNQSPAAGNRVVGWWRRWRQRAATLAELELLAGETDRVARDAGMVAGELRVLAGKWPDAADLAERRMAALGLDAAEVAATQPAVMRDVQRVCSLCASKRVCVHDLDHDPENATWHRYCPNDETFDALTTERLISRRHETRR